MRKTILCLSLFVLVSTCFVTNAMAAPKIMGVHGGYGVTATVVDGNGFNWQIIIKGPYMIYGMNTMGTISCDSATIRTPLFPPAFGFGKVCVKVMIDRIILPDVIEVRSAFMLGPFVLFINSAPC